MAKRFTDTDKWKKPFFRTLQAPYKLVWLYLLDDCDHAGIWNVEFDVLKLRTGINASEEEVLNVFGDRVVVFDDKTKWFIMDFIEFQYGELNPENRAHKSVIDRLTKYKIKPLISPLKGAKDKDKDKDKEKEPVYNEEFNVKYKAFIELFNEITGKQFRGDAKSKRNFHARLDDKYDFQQMRGAITTAAKSEYLRENPQYLTPEYITRPDKMEQWVNAAPTHKPHKLSGGIDRSMFPKNY